MSYFQKKGLSRIDQQFLAGGSFSNWVRLVRENGGVDFRYLLRSLYVSAVALAGVPFRAYEKVRFGTQIEETSIDAPPVFILGHWRSGTTYVMRMLAQDPQYAVVTFVHTMIPGLYMGTPIFRAILEGSLPEKRPMDNVTVAPDAGEEEEYALGNLSPYSFYHALSFPKRMREIFDKYVLFDGVPPEVVKKWQIVYLRFLKKVTFSSGGKRLLLKNPANTSRIRAILEIFPDAKFIHVCRNPYVVYSSTMNWLDKELTMTALQDVDEASIRENAMVNYERLMRRYLEDRHLIPEENLYEMKFEDFEADPLVQAERIYRQFGMPFGQQVYEQMERYRASLRGYRKNAYKLDRKTRRELTRRWGFAIRRWHYEPPNV